MTRWPHLQIGIITYNRPDEIRKTIQSHWQHIHYSGEITVIIADDATPGAYLPELMGWWTDNNPTHWKLTTLTTKTNSGWGVNANGLIRYGLQHGNLMFFSEDDYLLTQPLDLDIGVALLMSEPLLGMLRYRATAGTPMIYRGRETNVSAFLPNYREHYGYTLGRVNWLELDANSPTLWLYSNGPHLKRFDFHQCYGLYPEGLRLGSTEESMAHTVQDVMRSRDDALRIGILPAHINMIFDHIGQSYQFSEMDKGK